MAGLIIKTHLNAKHTLGFTTSDESQFHKITKMLNSFFVDSIFFLL
jgi:hypothetical protein